MSSSSAVRIELLGPPRVITPDRQVAVEGRTAALLAYVALEGAQPRSRMAGLLWPESLERTARANLRQLLRRLREAVGTDVLASSAAIELRDDVVVDARDASAPTLDDAAPAPFLFGVELDDAVDLARWLVGKRAEIERRRVDAYLAEAKRAETLQDLQGAIALAYRALALDDVCEPAYRLLMRLHFLVDDRAAAAAVYARCRVALRERLGATPSPETERVAEEILAQRRAPSRAPLAPRRVPLVVERPPVFAGREREWALMEEAWQQGRGIVIGGAPGVGKTRLMREFLSSRAKPLYVGGRPGDRAVPYGTHARTYRALLDAIEGGPPLPDWARRELARIIPELGESPGPLRTPEDKLRFWSAKIAAYRLAVACGFDALGFDDLQYVDPASVEAGAYVLSQLQIDPVTRVRTLHCYRFGELPESTRAVLREAEASGAYVHIELAPLSEAAVVDLIAGLGIPELVPLASEIAEYAGGTPLLALETVKHLLETGDLAPGFAARLSPAARPVSVLQRRLAMLDPTTLQLARALAVLAEEFTLERAAMMLELSVAETAVRWSELEAAQIAQTAAFTHDLLAEAVLAATPAAVHTTLHRRAAVALQATAASAARVADHWQRAGDTAQADASRAHAAVIARQSLLEQEAMDYFK